MNIGISYDQFIEERIAIKAKRFNSILNRAADNDDQYALANQDIKIKIVGLE